MQTTIRPLKIVREKFTNQCVKTLSGYRKNVATSSQMGQLVLPESFKLYPLFTLVFIKSKGFIGSNMASTDERNFHFKMLLRMGLGASNAYFYPRMVGIHQLDAGCGDMINNRVILPRRVRLTNESLEGNGIYIIGKYYIDSIF